MVASEELRIGNIIYWVEGKKQFVKIIEITEKEFKFLTKAGEVIDDYDVDVVEFDKNILIKLGFNKGKGNHEFSFNHKSMLEEYRIKIDLSSAPIVLITVGVYFQNSLSHDLSFNGEIDSLHKFQNVCYSLLNYNLDTKPFGF